MKLTKKWTTAAAICAAGFCSAANAVPVTWTDTVTLFPAPLVTAFTSDAVYSYTHTIEGFNTSTDSVDNFTLTFNLFDDQDRESEHAVAGSLLGAWEINNFGSLTVAVAAIWGDFYVGGSTLTVNGQRRAVSEPGTLALLGAALLAFGLLRRRRKSF